MADRDQERHYKPAGLNRWFAISSILLLAAVVGVFLEDYNREWKRYQRDFREIDRQITRGAYDTELARLAGEVQYQQAVDAATAARDRQDALQADIRTAEREVRRADTDFQGSTSATSPTRPGTRRRCTSSSRHRPASAATSTASARARSGCSPSTRNRASSTSKRRCCWKTSRRSSPPIVTICVRPSAP